jgi:hypothetical protein
MGFIAFVNSVDPDQTTRMCQLIRIYTVADAIKPCIFGVKL